MKDLEFIKEQRAQAWREELRTQISAKDRGNIERISMPEQDPIERSKNLLKQLDKERRIATDVLNTCNIILCK